MTTGPVFHGGVGSGDLGSYGAGFAELNFGRAARENVGPRGGAGFDSHIRKLKMPVLTTLNGLRAFLGLTEYYRRFVKGYSAIAWALMKQRGSRLRSCTYSFWNSTLRTRFLVGRGVVMRLLLGGLG